MATNKGNKGGPGLSGPNLLVILILGVIFGYFATEHVLAIEVEGLWISVSVGIVWAYLLIQWVMILRTFAGSYSNPIPVDLDLGNRDTVRSHAESLSGSGEWVARARNLLQAWGNGMNPGQLVSLSALQSSRARRGIHMGVVMSLIILTAGIWQQGNPILTWSALVAVGLTVYARIAQINSADAYLETRILTRLPDTIPGTAMTAKEVADALGGAIDQAFRDYVPEPEDLAAALKSAVENAGKQNAEEAGKIQKALTESGNALKEGFSAAGQKAAEQLEQASRSIASATEKISSGMESSSGKLQSALSGHVQELQNALQGVSARIKDSYDEVIGQLQSALSQHAREVENAGGNWKDLLSGLLTDHASKLESANRSLADQLEKIAALEKEIQEVLHIQEVVDGTLKSVAAAEEFKQTLSSLRSHLEESDNLLREVSKPRTIRLIEQEGEIAEG